MDQSQTIENVKIYGERNTGTSFVRELLKKNFVVTTLAGTISGDANAKRTQLRKSIADQPDVIRRVIIDRLNTKINNDMVTASFGWKHTNPPIEFLRSVPEMTARTLFVVVVKHPVFWAMSYQKRPYDSYFRLPEMSFHEYIRHIFVPTGRDNVDGPVYDSLIQLYAAKVDGYRRLAELGVPFELVRYEELLTNVPAFLKHVEETYGLARRRHGELIRQDSTKGDAQTLADYQAKYRLDKVKEAVSPEDYEFVLANFGRDRLAWLGYAVEAA